MMITGQSVCNTIAFRTIEQLLLGHGMTDISWPITEAQMSQILNCYVRGTTLLTGSSDGMFLVKYLIHEVLSFYEILHNENVKDKSILRYIYSHYCRVLQTVKDQDVCTDTGLGNLEEFRNAMFVEAQKVCNVA
jgi:hypothetical protein